MLTIVLSVGLGWFLGQFTSLAKFLFQRHLLSRKLAEEVAELHDSGAIGVKLGLERSYQLFCNGGIDGRHPMDLQNDVYKVHFKDALLVLNRYQKPALRRVHQYVDETNKALEELRRSVSEIDGLRKASKSVSVQVESHGGLLRQAIFNSAHVIWHAREYIEHPLLPQLSPYTPEHDRYIEFHDALMKSIQDIERAPPIPVKLFSPHERLKNVPLAGARTHDLFIGGPLHGLGRPSSDPPANNYDAEDGAGKRHHYRLENLEIAGQPRAVFVADGYDLSRAQREVSRFNSLFD